MLDFGQITESSETPRKPSRVENRKFFQYICPMYFLKKRNYDLFNLKIIPRGFVQIIRIEGIITNALCKRYIREMYSKNIHNNRQEVFAENCRIFWPFIKFLTNSSKIEQNPCADCKMLDFGQISESSETPRKPSRVENRKFFQYICPMYFLKNRNYDLFNLKIIPRGFVQIIRIEGIITNALVKDT